MRHTSSPPSFLTNENPHLALCQQYLNTLLRGDRREAGRLVIESVESGTPVKEAYLHVFQPALYEIGRLWQINRISVAEEHFFTAATQLVMSQLYSYVFTSEKREFKMVAACAGDELHEVGVRMVADFFEIEGWDTYYLGANMPAESVLSKVLEYKPHLLALSATMSYHSRAVEEVVRRVRSEPDCAGVRIMVGGACFRMFPNLWRKVGADGFAIDALQAVARARELVGAPA